jgi:MFS family permease
MTMMGLVKNYTGLLIARVFLGMMEAGYFPGVAFYLTNFYKRDELAFRIAIFFSMATFAGAFGGILAYGIGHMNGVGGFQNGWHWIFILGIFLRRQKSDSIEGTLTVIVSCIAHFFILDVFPPLIPC